MLWPYLVIGSRQLLDFSELSFVGLKNWVSVGKGTTQNPLNIPCFLWPSGLSSCQIFSLLNCHYRHSCLIQTGFSTRTVLAQGLTSAGNFHSLSHQIPLMLPRHQPPPSPAPSAWRRGNRTLVLSDTQESSRDPIMIPVLPACHQPDPK